ncbi:metallopeptidase TldD-related protein [Enterococcus faecalis]|uniref:metallopeptidase TldD-related protein n=1 Tax=Enterococcus faecalis TaxID=1351 RepID=UPI0001B2B271|nr:metallopeptidase TldD-related protein [Enterococcus faecalis]EEU25990.1 predicted protein [Enterococcus faecalis T8]ETU35474.1 hypothetical protein P016_01851 [Enterococcus faecalis EnGen0416]
METFETDIRLFIFRKREVIKINEITDIRWTEYFRMVFLHNETSTYEDYDISLLLNLESFIELIQRKEQEFIKLIKLPILKENIDINLYDWLFMPAIGGYFIHETVGHLLEMDNKGTYRLDQVVAGKFLDVIDTFYDYENLIGLNKYDDNGIRLEAIKLITKGTIKNFLGDRGSLRKENFSFVSLPRMRATVVENSDFFNESDLSRLKKNNDHLKIQQIYGGGVDVGSGHYQLLVRGIVVIKNKDMYRIENLILEGKSTESLKRIIYVGKDKNCKHAYCYKKNQMVDVVVGSPTLYLKNGEKMKKLKKILEELKITKDYAYCTLTSIKEYNEFNKTIDGPKVLYIATLKGENLEYIYMYYHDCLSIKYILDNFKNFKIKEKNHHTLKQLPIKNYYCFSNSVNKDSWKIDFFDSNNNNYCCIREETRNFFIIREIKKIRSKKT